MSLLFRTCPQDWDGTPWSWTMVATDIDTEACAARSLLVLLSPEATGRQSVVCSIEGLLQQRRAIDPRRSLQFCPESYLQILFQKVKPRHSGLRLKYRCFVNLVQRRRGQIWLLTRLQTSCTRAQDTVAPRGSQRPMQTTGSIHSSVATAAMLMLMREDSRPVQRTTRS
jgi:hypothetical protein